MFSDPTPDVILEELGDKVVGCLSQAVANGRADLDAYRSMAPLWVAEASSRGLANWVHDRLWAHVGRLADDLDDVHLVEKGPKREVVVGYQTRIRIKRHNPKGAVRSYPTHSALAFVTQESSQLLLHPDFAERKLMAGYIWNRRSNDLGDAVISYHDHGQCIWIHPLPEASASGNPNTGPIVPSPPGPRPPKPIVEVTSPRTTKKPAKN